MFLAFDGREGGLGVGMVGIVEHVGAVVYWMQPHYECTSRHSRWHLSENSDLVFSDLRQILEQPADSES